MGKPGVRRYDDSYYCSHCGEWVSKENVVFDKAGGLRHGFNKLGKWCGSKVRSHPRTKVHG